MVVDECVQVCFNSLSKGTIAEAAVLSFKMVPLMAQCRGCGKSFLLKELDWACPYCGNIGMEIVAGKELFLESIEVE